MNFKKEIIILTRGKTGSTTILHSIEKYIPCDHFHNQTHFQNVYKTDMLLNDYIEKCQKTIDEQLILISIYRDPIERIYSSFFENYRNYSEFNDTQINLVDPSLLISSFYTHYDFELYDPFEDIKFIKINYSEILTKKLETDKYKLLFLTFEEIKHWDDLIRKETRFKDIILKASNISSDKFFDEIYRKFKKTVKLPLKIIDDVFQREEKYIKFFYGEKKAKEIYDIWLDKYLLKETNFINMDDYFLLHNEITEQRYDIKDYTLLEFVIKKIFSTGNKLLIKDNSVSEKDFFDSFKDCKIPIIYDKKDTFGFILFFEKNKDDAVLGVSVIVDNISILSVVYNPIKVELYYKYRSNDIYYNGNLFKQTDNISDRLYDILSSETIENFSSSRKIIKLSKTNTRICQVGIGLLDATQIEDNFNLHPFKDIFFSLGGRIIRENILIGKNVLLEKPRENYLFFSSNNHTSELHVNYQLSVDFKMINIFHYLLSQKKRIFFMRPTDEFPIEILEIFPNIILGKTFKDIKFEIIFCNVDSFHKVIDCEEKVMDKNSKVILDISAIHWFENYNEFWIERDMIKLNNFIDKYVDKIYTSNEKMKMYLDYYIERYIGIHGKNFIETVPIYFSKEEYVSVFSRKELGYKEEDIVFVNSGGCWSWTNIDNFLEAFFYVLRNIRKDIKLILCGIKQSFNVDEDNDKMSKKIKDIFRKNVDLLEHVKFNEWISREKVIDYLFISDIGLNLNIHSLETEFSQRVRITDYLALKLPILCSGNDSFTMNNVFNWKKDTIEEFIDYLSNITKEDIYKKKLEYSSLKIAFPDDRIFNIDPKFYTGRKKFFDKSDKIKIPIVSNKDIYFSNSDILIYYEKKFNVRNNTIILNFIPKYSTSTHITIDIFNPKTSEVKIIFSDVFYKEKTISENIMIETENLWELRVFLIYGNIDIDNSSLISKF